MGHFSIFCGVLSWLKYLLYWLWIHFDLLKLENTCHPSLKVGNTCLSLEVHISKTTNDIDLNVSACSLNALLNHLTKSEKNLRGSLKDLNEPQTLSVNCCCPWFAGITERKKYQCNTVCVQRCTSIKHATLLRNELFYKYLARILLCGTHLSGYWLPEVIICEFLLTENTHFYMLFPKWR